MDIVASLEIRKCDAPRANLVLEVALQRVICFFQVAFTPRQIRALDLESSAIVDNTPMEGSRVRLGLPEVNRALRGKMVRGKGLLVFREGLRVGQTVG